MKRYLITSPRFTGQAELIYNDSRIIHISLVDTEMDASTAQAFIRCVSCNESEVASRFSDETKIVSADVEVTFEMFWKTYHKKINKARAVKLWNSLTETDRANAYVGIRPYNKYLFENKWRSKADPDTYLRNRYWENEYE